MEQMYKGMPFSPTATLTANISATDTIIPVSDVDAFPDAPNIATIGSIAGPNETIIYTGKTTTSLTGCTRGVEGTASDWAVDELIGRNFTAKDHADMVKNIEELESNKLDASCKVDVVNTADVSVGGKALDARQNNPSITGTLAQKVTSNTQQINDLNSKFSNFNVIPLFSGGVEGGEGGEIHIARPQVSNLTNHITIDAQADFLRIYSSYNNELRGVKVNFAELTKNEIQDLATTEFVDLSRITFLNGFARYADASFGCISKSGKNVHVNILLSCNGASHNTICALPFVPAKNEIHYSEGIQFRTHGDGRLVCEGSLPNTGGYFTLDINYTCV